MIINITGPNGSGKSTLVKKLIADAPVAVRNLTRDQKKVLGYTLRFGANKTVGVIGKYETPCGGCDTMSSQREVRALIEEYAELYNHVIFEGVIVSTCFGTYYEFLKKLNAPYLFLILLPSVDVCIERVQERRAARGVDPLKFNVDNLKGKHAYIQRVAERCKAEGISSLVWRSKNSAYRHLRKGLAL